MNISHCEHCQIAKTVDGQDISICDILQNLILLKENSPEEDLRGAADQDRKLLYSAQLAHAMSQPIPEGCQGQFPGKFGNFMHVLFWIDGLLDPLKEK